jgi:glyoxylase-like metal-dependent hydrolase (beta-lactamase superfamily II)
MSIELRCPGQLRTLRLGETKISYVPDGVVQLRPRTWLPATTEADWAKHPEYLDETGNLVASIGGLLVEHDDRAMLIDAGVGAVSIEPDDTHGALDGGTLIDNLATLGLTKTDIEAVAFTHLHVDHAGWAPAFTAAEYLVTEPEWATASPSLVESLTPRVRIVSDGEEIFPNVRVQFTGGHTPGHAAYVVTEANQRLIAFGDALHSPVQFTHPEWSAVVDHDTRLSTEWRRRLAEELAKPDTIGFGIHFANVQFGRMAGEWLPVVDE